MRSILRAAGRTARVFLWIVRGLLLILAVGAVVLWPMSRGRVMGVDAERHRAGPASGEYRRYTAECWDGRALLGRGWRNVGGGPWLDRIRAEVQSGGEGWRWRRWSNASTWAEGSWPSRCGPLRWYFIDDNDSDGPNHNRYVAAPLWGVALAAGAWPLASIPLLIRRRRKGRRLTLVGCCQQCGYDLRATSAADGPLLARCPECGAESPAVRSQDKCSATENTKDTERN